MLGRQHSTLAVAVALILPVQWLLPLGVATHLCMDKFIGKPEGEWVAREILTHLLILLIAILAQSLAIFAYAVVCFNLPDILKRLSPRLDPHKCLALSRVALSSKGQANLDLLCLAILIATVEVLV